MSSTTADASEPAMQDAWTYFEMEHDAVETLRDAIASGVPDEWERIGDSHISILPGFEIVADELEIGLEELAEAGSEFVGEAIQINGVECFHELDAAEPSFVVKLDVDIDLDDLRAEQTEIVEQHVGSIHYDPVAPHVTLFKAGDGGDEHDPLSEEQRAELRAAIDAVDVPKTLTVEGVEAATY